MCKKRDDIIEEQNKLEQEFLKINDKLNEDEKGMKELVHEKKSLEVLINETHKNY